jgi:hypothetical protein
VQNLGAALKHGVRYLHRMNRASNDSR